MTIQDNKHRLKDLRTDSSFKTSRNGDEEVSKRSRSKSKFTCKYTYRDREPKKKQVKHKTYYYKALYLVQCTTLVCNKKAFYPLISEFTLPPDCVEVHL